MLTVVWLGIAVVMCMWCCKKQIEAEKDDGDPFSWQIGGMGILILALTINANTTVIPLYNWLLVVLPEPGTTLNQFTSLIMTAVLFTLFVVGIPLARLMMLIPDNEPMEARRSKSKSENVIPWPRKKR